MVKMAINKQTEEKVDVAKDADDMAAFMCELSSELGPSGDGRTSLKVLVTNDFGSFGRATLGFITSDICALLIKMKPFLIKRQLMWLCSTRHAECRPGSNASLPELSGCPCVLENSQSSVRSNVVSTSNVTDTCLGNCILVGYPYYRFVAFVSSFGYIHHVVCILLTLYVLRLSLADTVTTPAAPNIGPPSSYAHLGNCDHNCQHCDARFWYEERIKNSAKNACPEYHRCCMGGRVVLFRQFTRDNNCTVEFDAFGFSVRDFLTRHILLRCDSSGDLYPVTPPSPIPKALLSVSPTTWHQRLEHPGEDVLRSLVSRTTTQHTPPAEPITPTLHTTPVQTTTIQIPPTQISTTQPTPAQNPLPHTNQPTRTHPMVTRAQVGTVKPNPRFHGHTSHISPLPMSPSIALSDPNWQDVMYKARLVANVRSQQFGVDCDETFSPVVKPVTIRIVLSIALSRNWRVHQIDVKNAFLNGDLSEIVYMYQPPGFMDSRSPHHHGTEVAYLLIYVDEIILTASSTYLLQCISVTRDSTGMFLSQKKYAMKLLDRVHMASCNPTRTPFNTESKLNVDGDLISDPTLYRSLAALKRILRYVRGTLNFGLQLYAPSIGSFVSYSDANWAGCPTTRCSTFGYCVFLGDNLLSWSSKRQHTLSLSSTEAE
ncbi:ribonuclease H-like domain-containing protein [Tanacetum coccineum]|uniref:Ribonuclease H-like domain-containing protein n=1 Tax=Tanacetum coccineum TaxID=301880 RepID=A0ABQ5D2U2_9ASTR